MAPVNFSNNIHARGRELHLQTNTLDEDGKVVSTLFDGGRVLVKEEVSFFAELSGEELTEHVNKLHTERKSSIELLYDIGARVKTVRHPLSLNRLGCQFMRWNLLDEAIGEFEFAIQYDPDYGEAYLNLAKAYLKRKAIQEALEVLGKAVKIAPDYADIWHTEGRAFLLNDQYIDAIKAFQQALKINPSYDEPHLFMAMCLMKVMDRGIQDRRLPDSARCRQLVKEHLSRAAAISVRFQTSDFEEAMRKFHKEEVKKAIEILEKVCAELKEVANLDFHDSFYLKFMYGEHGRDIKVVQDYVDRMDLISKRYPKFPDLHNNLAIGHLIQCRNLFNKALNELRTACEINPKYKRAKRNLKLAENDGKGLLILLRALIK
jgi:tetratricopeptide (TPR) repeat protein